MVLSGAMHKALDMMSFDDCCELLCTLHIRLTYSQLARSLRPACEDTQAVTTARLPHSACMTLDRHVQLLLHANATAMIRITKALGLAE